MPNTHNNMQRFKLATILIVAIAFLAFGGPTFALPTAQRSSGSASDFHTHYGYQNNGSHSQGNHLWDASSSWGSSYDENSDGEGDGSDDGCNDGYDDYDGEDGYDDYGDNDGCNGNHDDGYGDNGNYDDDYGDDDGNSAPVPEPTTALLMSLGLAGSAYLKRRRK